MDPTQVHRRRPPLFVRVMAWLLMAMLASCGPGDNKNTTVPSTNAAPTLQGLRATQQADGSVYFTGTYQGQPVKVAHQGAAGAGTWTAYAGTTATNRIRYTLSDVAGLREVLAMDTGLRITVQTVGTERVEYRVYSATGAFQYGAVLWQVNQRWWMAVMPTEDFRGYDVLLGPKDVTATLAPALTAAAGGSTALAAPDRRMALGATGQGAVMPQGFIAAGAFDSMKSAALIGVATVTATVVAVVGVAETAALVTTVAGAAAPFVVPAGIVLGGGYLVAEGAEALLKFFNQNTANQEPAVEPMPDAPTQADYQAQTQPTAYTTQPAPVPPAPTVPSPQVSSVTPSSATVGQSVNLVVSGTGLGGFYGINVVWDGCALTAMGGTDTSKTYQCTPATLGRFNGRVTDPVSGALLSSFTVDVTQGGFTKIALDGTALPDTATTWSCVRHNATGLLWEAHVTRQTPAHPCAWDPTLTCTGYTNFGDGSAYDASAVTGSVCGKPGRLPTVDEGTALVNDPAYAAANPTPGAFMTTWFGADDIAWWGWTSSPVVGYLSYAWVVGFGYGNVFSYSRGYVNYGNVSFNVRLVAGP